jgi:sensor domain CHASE-containing protein
MKCAIIPEKVRMCGFACTVQAECNATVTQAVQHLQQLVNVVEMQPRGRFIQNINRLARAAFEKLFRQLDALRFPTESGKISRRT